MNKYSLVIKNGFIVDPINRRNDFYDIAVDTHGKISKVEKEISGAAEEIFDATGLIVSPGIIDCHMHASPEYGGASAHKMLAKAGVVTAIELGGPVQETIPLAVSKGCGLNIAFLNVVKPGETIGSPDPSTEQIEDLLEDSLHLGAIGFKILGGHFPLSPEGTRRVMDVSYDKGSYIAFHAGSLANGSNLNGFKEAVDLAKGKYLHLAHINSYCRGLIKDAEQEAEEALTILKENRNIHSESYLSRVNGLSGRCRNEVPESVGAQAALKIHGYPPTEKGLEEAIRNGHCLFNAEVGGEIRPVDAETGVRLWKSSNATGGMCSISFTMNPSTTRLRLACAKKDRREFVINAISTDGGGIPRNDQVEKGLALVRADALTLEEFVLKVSAAPAAMLGLPDKGHLGEGADADISVFSLKTLRPVLSVALGKIIMHEGLIFGHGTHVITTRHGQTKLESMNPLGLTVLDLKERPFLTRRLNTPQPQQTKS